MSKHKIKDFFKDIDPKILEAMCILGNFVISHPKAWDTYSMHLKHPELTQRKLAKTLKISTSSVCHHIAKSDREIGYLIIKNPEGKS